MKEGRSLTDLAIEIDRQARAKKDFMASTNQLTLVPVDGPAKVHLQVADQGAYPLSDLALTQMGERVGIPAKYARRMRDEAPDLLATNVNRWFRQEPTRRMVRTLNGRVRSFMSDAYQRIDNNDVANVVLPVLQTLPELKVLSTEITESRLYIKVSSGALTGRVDKSIRGRAVGDMVEAGILITNSEVGLGAVSVTGFANFLICLNGMVRDGGKRWNHIGRRATEDGNILLADDTRIADDRAQLLVIRDTVNAVMKPELFDNFIARLNGSTEKRIEGDVNAGIEVLADTLGLTVDEQSSILRHLIQGGDLSQYGLMNAVTRTATDAVSYDRATELEAFGGRVLDLAPNEWRKVAMAEAA